ncbi:hypothetical protein [Photobacterium frigidiphilum]|uniref:hypothetical protein n=1 Tax=Photobacterium frigidiphilum TaxID=264736 RepID=UPI00187F8851|nr:hypothetical protein [Photobacterium frigidiphilum]
MYDTNAVYQTLEDHHSKRMSNLIGCFALGIIGCSILNRFTHIGMPNSYRVA